MVWIKDNFLQQFQLNPTVGYHPESVEHVFHISGEQLRKAAVVVGLGPNEKTVYMSFLLKEQHILSTTLRSNQLPRGKTWAIWPLLWQFTYPRELHEEVGIRSTKLKLLGNYQHWKYH